MLHSQGRWIRIEPAGVENQPGVQIGPLSQMPRAGNRHRFEFIRDDRCSHLHAVTDRFDGQFGRQALDRFAVMQLPGRTNPDQGD